MCVCVCVDRSRRADEDGGALACQRSGCWLFGGQLSANHAKTRGGAVAVLEIDSMLMLTEGVFVEGNSAGLQGTFVVRLLGHYRAFLCLRIASRRRRFC